MALWVIGYGFVQASAPIILKKITKGEAPDGRVAVIVSSVLTAVMVVLSTLFVLDIFQEVTVVAGLLIFGVVFALNSSVHSFLVLDYADGDKAAVNVGFYYMANAVGRLVGTLLSGLLFSIGGVAWALFGSALFLLISSLITGYLPKSKS